MKLPKTISLDSAAFMRKTRYGIDGGENVKFGGE
jgi:hypothetical protein